MLEPKTTILTKPADELPPPQGLTDDGRLCRDLIARAEVGVEPEDRLLSVDEAAQRLGVSPQTLRNWEKLGKLVPHSKTDGGHRRYLESRVNAIRRKQMAAHELILPDITPARLRQLWDGLLSNFGPDDKVQVTISCGVVDNVVKVSVDSDDGLTSVSKTFRVED